MPSDLTLQMPVKADVTPDDAKVINEVHTLTVKDKETHGVALQLLKRLAAGKKYIIDKLSGIKAKTHASWKDVCKLENEETAPYDAAIAVVNNRLDVYEKEEKRRALDEANRKAEEQRKEEQARRDQEIALAKKTGATKEEVKQLKAEPLPIPTATPAPAFAKVGGVANRGSWKGSVKDMRKFIRWLAKQPDDEGWFHKVEIAQEDLNNAARMHELALPDRVPGLFAEKVFARSVSTK